jgi:hypothetical protein
MGVHRRAWLPGGIVRILRSTMALRPLLALPLLLPALAACQRSASGEAPPSLMERLAQEGATRPTDTPRAEQVLAALQSAGLVLGEQRQYLGATSGARYCFSARSLRGLQLSVCEFDDAESASRGRGRVLGERPPPGRTVLLNRATTLLVQPSVDSPGAQAEARVAAQTFAKL